MVFNSLQFLVFFPLVLLGYYLLPGRARWVWLLAASLYAYGVWQPLFLIHLLAVTGAAYLFGRRIEAAQGKPDKKRWLVAGLVVLVGNLFVFKYTAFVNETLRDAFTLLGVAYPVGPIHLLLPLGVSFYTFQLIAYLVDVFRGARAEHHAGRFALYVAFFPKMVAGPIERAGHLLPQLHRAHPFDARAIAGGLQLIAWGAFKKVVVADRLAPFVGQVYGDPHAYSGVVTVFATLLFAFQVYCDFSGYSDMAVGVAQTFGIRLTNNFNRPYLATSIQDFWKRWHISLTSWLTDYIYTPLTRSRRIKVKWFYLMLASLFVTFVVSGLWHGAQWTFVAWGALHGTYLVTSVLTQKWRTRLVAAVALNRFPKLHRWLRIACTFSLVCLAYVLFQAASLSDALFILSNLGTGWGSPISAVRIFLWDAEAEFLVAACGVVVVLAIEAFQDGADVRAWFVTRPPLARWGLYYATVLSIVLLGAFYGASQRFIYFQF